MIAIHVNGEALEFEGTTVEQLVQHLGIARQGVAIAVNADVVPRSLWSEQVMNSGDRVELVTAAAGG